MRGGRSEILFTIEVVDVVCLGPLGGCGCCCCCCCCCCGGGGGVGVCLSTTNLPQLGFSFSASARIFLSYPKSKLKVLRGISTICGAN